MSHPRGTVVDMDILWLLLGLAIGLGLGLFVGRRGAGSDPRLRSDLAQAERQAAQVPALTERLAAERDAHAQALAAQSRAHERELAAQQHAHEQALAAERTHGEEKIRALTADTQRLSEQFEALGTKVLEQAQTKLAEVTKERLEATHKVSDAELAKRQEAVERLVEPIARTLGEVRAQLNETEKKRAGAQSALIEQVNAMRADSHSLREETSQLVTALRAPQVRGRWGELQLRNVVESAGMVEHVDFVEQSTYQTDDGALRPDLIVTLPGDKHVVVDSKVAFAGYLEAMEAKDEKVRNERLAAHAKHVRAHIDSLGSKAYWEHVPHTPEFVVMFLPAEAFLNAALEEDPTLFERAFSQNVVLATPATLVALLRTVSYTWRQEVLAENAEQVFTAGRELHKRLATLGKHIATMSKRLNATVEAFNKFNNSLDSQLVTQVRRFSQLQGFDSALEVPPPLEIMAVPAGKEDLYTPAISAADGSRGADEIDKAAENAAE